MPEIGHRARAQGRAIHDRRIELRFPVAVEHRADAGIEQGIVFQRADRRGHRIEAGAALLEHRIAGIARRFEPRAIQRFALRRDVRPIDHPGTAMNHDGERLRVRGADRRNACGDANVASVTANARCFMPSPRYRSRGAS